MAERLRDIELTGTSTPDHQVVDLDHRPAHDFMPVRSAAWMLGVDLHRPTQVVVYLADAD